MAKRPKVSSSFSKQRRGEGRAKLRGLTLGGSKGMTIDYSPLSGRVGLTSKEMEEILADGIPPKLKDVMQVIGVDLATKMDKAIMATIKDGCVTNVQEIPPQEPLTIDKINEMIRKVRGPRFTWLSSKLFDRDKFQKLTTEDEIWLTGHPNLWSRAMVDGAIRQALDINPFGLNRLHGIEIINCDIEDDDSPMSRDRKRKEMLRWAEAMMASNREMMQQRMRTFTGFKMGDQT